MGAGNKIVRKWLCHVLTDNALPLVKETIVVAVEEGSESDDIKRIAVGSSSRVLADECARVVMSEARIALDLHQELVEGCRIHVQTQAESIAGAMVFKHFQNLRPPGQCSVQGDELVECECRACANVLLNDAGLHVFAPLVTQSFDQADGLFDGQDTIGAQRRGNQPFEAELTHCAVLLVELSRVNQSLEATRPGVIVLERVANEVEREPLAVNE